MKGKTDKSIQTRNLIYESAIKLFQTKGYDKATMRMISSKAKLSLGLTYYHFKSKEEIVLEFYKLTQIEAEQKCLEYFLTEKNLKSRIEFIILFKFKQFFPYKNFLHILAKVSSDPKHPLSPFSKETSEIRNGAIGIFKKALEENSEKYPKDFEEILPEIFWLYQMGTVFFWLIDESIDKKKSFKLVSLSLDLIFQLFKLSKLPFTKTILKKIIEVYKLIITN